MKLNDAKAAYEALSGKASDIVRQLSFAGIALIWLFHTDSKEGTALDQGLLRAAWFIFLTLLLDFLQYLVGTVIWFLYFRHKEKSGTSEDAEFLAPARINWPMWVFFFLKSAATLTAYIFYILPFLVRKFVE